LQAIFLTIVDPSSVSGYSIGFEEMMMRKTLAVASQVAV
jgi:hypothetical protein